MPWPFSKKNQPDPPEGSSAPEHSTVDSSSKASSALYERIHETRPAPLDVPYLLPKDSDEINRLDFQHHLLRAMLKGNTTVPLTHPISSILDVGCGTGIWGSEMAQDFPEAQIVGIDLQEVQRPDRPENYMFVQCNLLDGIPFPNNYFDFVHMRFLINAIPKAMWPTVIQTLFQVTRPGGTIELIEAGGDPYRPGGWACTRMYEAVIQVAAFRGIDPREMYNLGNHCKQAGFTQIQTRKIEAPIGRWSGRAGTMLATDMTEGMKSFKEPIQKIVGYTAWQFDDLTDQVVREWEEYHSTYTCVIYTAQKPLTDTYR